MITKDQILELDRAAEEEVQVETKTEELSRNQGSKTFLKYKTVFNCSCSEAQE